MKNRTMTTLRDGLMDVLDGLMNKDKPLDPEIAKTYAAVAQVVVNSIKEEIAFMKATGGKGTGFIPEEKTVESKPEEIEHAAVREAGIQGILSGPTVKPHPITFQRRDAIAESSEY